MIPVLVPKRDAERQWTELLKDSSRDLQIETYPIVASTRKADWSYPASVEYLGLVYQACN